MEEKLAYLKNLSFSCNVNEEENAQKKKVKFAENIDKKKEQAAKKLHSLISKGDDVGLDFNKDDKILILQTCSTHKNYQKYAKKFLLIISKEVKVNEIN